MQTLNISLPQGVNIPERDVLTAVATRLYDTGKLTIEQAAELARYDLSAFIEELMGQSLQESKSAAARY
jgi:predicted HTH domain antitoxin